MAVDTNWLRYCDLVIQESVITGTTNLSNFPVLITADCLPQEVTDSADSNAAKSDGSDIRFTSDSGGANELAFEIVHFTQASGTRGTCEIWVNVGTVNYSSNTTIYIWYDNSAASAYSATDTYGRDNTWTSDYVAVLHLGEAVNNTTDGYVDSSGTGSHGTGTSMSLTAVTGAFGSGSVAQDFDGTADYIKIPSAQNPLNGITNGGVSVWFKSSDTSSGLPRIVSNGGNDDLEISINYSGGTVGGVSNGNVGAFIRDTGGWYNVGAASSGSWNKVDFVGTSASGFDFYINGASAASSGTNWTNGVDSDLIISAEENSGSPTAMVASNVDELRIFNAEKSADWVQAEYANQNSPTTFVVEGTPAANGGGATGMPSPLSLSLTGVG